MATRRCVAVCVNGIKYEMAQMDGMAVALIGLPAIVQSLDEAESLDSVVEWDTCAPAGLQFVAFDP
jgi:hypothetical protein